jgi:hypothetical protein
VYVSVTVKIRFCVLRSAYGNSLREFGNAEFPGISLVVNRSEFSCVFGVAVK